MLAPLLSTAQIPLDSLLHTLPDTFESLMQQRGWPSLSVAIVHDQEIILSYASNILENIEKRQKKRLDKYLQKEIEASKELTKLITNATESTPAKKQQADISSASIWYNAGCNTKDHDSKIYSYTQAITLNPEHIHAYNNRGNAYQSLGKYDESIRDYNQAIALNPLYELAYYYRGISYRNLRRYDEAIQDHKKAIEILPDHPSGYYSLGCVYWVLSDWRAVIKTWEKCLEVDFEYKKVLELLPRVKQFIRNE